MSSSNNFNHYDCDTKMLEIYNNYQNSGEILYKTITFSIIYIIAITLVYKYK